jgi:uncharacterized protein YggU (UPF0235/DUF167 family)
MKMKVTTKTGLLELICLTQIPVGKAIILYVTVTPKSQKNILQSIAPDPQGNGFMLKAKIRGVPENNQVNNNLLRFLAKELHTGVSALKLVSGHHSRHKILQINQNALSKQ